MERLFYKDKEVKSVGVYGLGRSNLGVLRYLNKHYPYLKLILRNDSAKIPKDVTRVAKFDEIYIGNAASTDIREDLVFLSPTVRKDKLRCDAHTAFTSDAQFYFENARNPTLAITGSDGKSTTTTLTALMLSSVGDSVPAIGNIGVPMTPQLDKALRYAVAELSSFQLMNFSPKCMRALITNVSENHLDFHSSYDEYIWAKENILRECAERIFNYDCEVSQCLMSRYSAFGVYSLTKSEEELKKSVSAEVYVTLSDSFVVANGEKIFDTGMLKCKNRHTIANFAAAVALTYGIADRARIRQVAEEFSGLAHRCECVGVFSGIKYINSSIDSTPKRTVTTLSSFSERLTVILGGKSKGLDYKTLLPTLTERAKRVVLTGATAGEIKAVLLSDTAFCESGIPIIEKTDFEEAVLAAIRASELGDTVILSPASTSFDAFRDFEERGKKFKEIIRNYYYKRT